MGGPWLGWGLADDLAHRRLGGVAHDRGATRAVEQDEGDAPAEVLLVAAHELEPALEGNRRRLHREPQLREEPLQSFRIAGADAPQAGREARGEHHAGGHRLTVQPRAVAAERDQVCQCRVSLLEFDVVWFHSRWNGIVLSPYLRAGY